MAASDREQETLLRSFSGLGVDETSVILTLGKWRPEQRQSFRRTCSRFFGPDGHHPHGFERWRDDHVKHLELEFSRFKKAVISHATHPWERDARWAHLVVTGELPESTLIEITCTRSSEELLGARRAYQSLFHRSLEEDLTGHVKGPNARMLVALTSALRYEGTRVDDARVKADAKVLSSAVRRGGGGPVLMEDTEMIRIMTTRSKAHLSATFRRYKKIHGTGILEDLAGGDSTLLLSQMIQCFDSPPVYFCKVLDEALRGAADEHARDGLTRVAVTRADVDMKEIKEVYQDRNGVSLEEKIASTTCGNYKNFLLTLVGRE